MLAYEIREENMKFIVAANDGVEPAYESEKTYFIVDNDGEPDIISEKTLNAEYRIVRLYHMKLGRLRIEKK